MHYTKYNTVCGVVAYNLSCYTPIKVYKQFILKMDLHRFRTQNELFLYFSKKVTFYLNIYCNLKYNLMFSCNLSAPITLPAVSYTHLTLPTIE